MNFPGRENKIIAAREILKLKKRLLHMLNNLIGKARTANQCCAFH